jgi:hypothetical protein
VHVVVQRPSIAVRHETREARVAKTAPRVSPKSKPDGRTVAEIHQKAEHI